MGQLVWITESGWHEVVSTDAKRAHWYDEAEAHDFPKALCGFTTQGDVHPVGARDAANSPPKCSRCLRKLDKLGIAAE